MTYNINMNDNVLSIDPSLLGTGYAVFNDKQSLITYGEISTKSKDDIDKRLYNIYNNLKDIIDIYKPKYIIIEKMFINMNGTTSMNIAAVRGIIILLCGQYNIPYREVLATSVRKSVIGSGKAIKSQVRHYITQILDSQNFQLNNPSHNIIDAIAVGMYFFSTHNNPTYIER